MNQLLTSTLIMALSLCFPWSLHAQSQIKFDRILTEQGLSNNYIQCIIQDKKGFIWIGTQDGLNRYDGYQFIVLKYDPHNRNSLSSNFVWTIYEDSSGILWIGTNGGLNRFDPVTETFTRYQHDPENANSVSNNVVRSIIEDKSGTLWVGTETGLNKFDRRTGAFTRYKHDPNNPNSLSHDYIGVLHEDRRGILWVGTGDIQIGLGGLNRFDNNTESFMRYRHEPSNPTSLVDDWVTAIMEDHDGNLWIGTDKGLDKLDQTTGVFSHYPIHIEDSESPILNYIKCIGEDETGGIWIGTWEQGLFRFDKGQGRFVRYMTDQLDPMSLSNNTVWTICQDRAGMFWTGTWSGGVCKFKPTGSSFHHYPLRGLNDKLAGRSDVRSIYEDRHNTVWIGTMSDLFKIQRESGTLTPVPTGELYVYSLAEGRAGILWVGTANGLFRFEKASGRKTRHRTLFGSLPFREVTALLTDSADVLWVGTQSRGLQKLEFQLGKSTHFVHDSKDPASLNHNNLDALCLDRSGKLWVGTLNGLARLDGMSRGFKRYTHAPDNPRSLSDNDVRSIYEDRRGTLWIGTSGGLNRFDRASESFTHYTRKDGLSNDLINGILEDGKGNLWISTSRGISRFDLRKQTFRNFDVADGLPMSQFNRGAYFCNMRGEMFFGGLSGFMVFHPDSVRDNPHVPPVVITDFRLFNEPVKIGGDTPLQKAVSWAETITLSYDQNSVAFEFSALDYSVPKKNEYRYMLEGFDDDWIRARNRRYADYTNLPPGEYIFRAKGSNSDGIWNEQGTSIAIVITPPWWKTTWAYAGYTFAIVALLYSIRRSEKNRDRLKHQAELEHTRAESLQEVDSMKSRFFANISHEFRTPLTLIEGPAKQILAGETAVSAKENAGIIVRNTRRRLTLVNQLLDLSKIESGQMKLHVRETDIVEAVRGITASFESLSVRKGITFSVVTPPESIVGWFDRDAVEKIVTNLLSNAFKFTRQGGEVRIEIRNLKSEIRNQLQITVTDTGIGIPADQLDKIFDRFYQVDASQTREQEGTGIGLALTKELVELHKGKITVQSEVGEGSTFAVFLPLSKEQFSSDEIVEAEGKPKQRVSSSMEMEEPRSVEIEEEAKEADEKLPLLLVVEDNADMRKYMRTYLDNQYKVTEAVNGEEGVQKAIEIIPDLIITDVMMPKMDGFEVCRKLKTDERTSHIPVILLTAKASSEHKLEGLETGADDYLTKPFDAKELLVRVRNLIEQRRKLQERFQREFVLQPKDVMVKSLDEKFLAKIIAVIESHLSDPNFDTHVLAEEVAMSRMQMHRKLHALINLGPGELIRSFRMKRAASLLRLMK